MATISAREFNRDVSAAKRAAEESPVVITDHGRPSHVLLSFAAYQAMTGPDDLVKALRMDLDVDIEFERVDIAARSLDL